MVSGTRLLDPADHVSEVGQHPVLRGYDVCLFYDIIRSPPLPYVPLNRVHVLARVTFNTLLFGITTVAPLFSHVLGFTSDHTMRAREPREQTGTQPSLTFRS